MTSNNLTQKNGDMGMRKTFYVIISILVLLALFTACEGVGGQMTSQTTEQTPSQTPDVPSKLTVPKITPAAGDYPDGFKDISLSTEIPDAEIYYTTDGSAPTDTSSRYTGPFRIIGSKTVKAIAYSGNQTSAVVTATYNLNAGKTASQLGVITGTLSLASNLSDEVKESLATSEVFIYSSELPGVVRQSTINESFYIDGLDTTKSYSFFFSNKAPGINVDSRAAKVQIDSNGKPIVSIKIDVTPEEGNGTDLGKVTLKPTGTITGKAFRYGENGEKESDHAGITVFIPGTSFVAFTASDGAFSMTNVPQGMYVIRAMYAGYTYSEQENILLSTDDDEEPRADIDTEFTLYYSKGTVKGSVILSDNTSGFSGIDILLTDVANAHSYSSVTTATGSWTVNDVTPGTYSIEFHKDGYVDQTMNDILVTGARVTSVPRIVLKEDGGTIKGNVTLSATSDWAGVTCSCGTESD